MVDDELATTHPETFADNIRTQQANRNAGCFQYVCESICRSYK
jgi:hypothetical protein